MFQVALRVDRPSQEVLSAGSFPVFCEFETGCNRVAEPHKVLVCV